MNIMKEAHKMTKEIKMEYPNVNYKAQLGICISYLSKKGEVEMVGLKGSEKQIAWAEKIKKEELEKLQKLDTVTTNNIEVATEWVGFGENEKVTESEIRTIYKTEEKFNERKKGLTKIKTLLENEASAKFIIENRSNLAQEIARKNDMTSGLSNLEKAFRDDVIRINF